MKKNNFDYDLIKFCTSLDNKRKMIKENAHRSKRFYVVNEIPIGNKCKLYSLNNDLHINDINDLYFYFPAYFITSYYIWIKITNRVASVYDYTREKYQYHEKN